MQISELCHIFILPRQCYHWNLYVISYVLSLEWRYFLLKKVFIFLVLLILPIPDINFNTALLSYFPCFSFRFTFSKKQKNLPFGLDFINVNYFPCIQPNVFQNVRLNARKVIFFAITMQVSYMQYTNLHCIIQLQSHKVHTINPEKQFFGCNFM